MGGQCLRLHGGNCWTDVFHLGCLSCVSTCRSLVAWSSLIFCMETIILYKAFCDSLRKDSIVSSRSLCWLQNDKLHFNLIDCFFGGSQRWGTWLRLDRKEFWSLLKYDNYCASNQFMGLFEATIKYHIPKALYLYKQKANHGLIGGGRQ